MGVGEFQKWCCFLKSDRKSGFFEEEKNLVGEIGNNQKDIVKSGVEKARINKKIR